MIPRARINKLSRSHEVRTDKDYRIYQHRLSEIEKDFQPSEKYSKKIGQKARFCDYCGVKLESNLAFCPNCGQKLD